MRRRNHIFIFGLGYVGQHLARALSQRGWQITGTTRDPDTLAGQVPASWTILPFTAGQRLNGLASHLRQVTHLISGISAVSGSDPVLDLHEAEIAAFDGWTGYLSATSVYPDQPAGWVDEDTPPAPVTIRGKARLTAEQRWQHTAQAELFRLAGIYGPGRNVLADLRAGTARIIDKPGQVFNRIHQTDISRIIMAAMAAPRPNRIINLCDNLPASQGDVVRYAAQLIKVSPPAPVPLEAAGLSAMALSFYAAQRRVRSKIIKSELGLSLHYPDYKSGLEALVRSDAP